MTRYKVKEEERDDQNGERKWAGYVKSQQLAYKRSSRPKPRDLELKVTSPGVQ